MKKEMNEKELSLITKELTKNINESIENGTIFKLVDNYCFKNLDNYETKIERRYYIYRLHFNVYKTLLKIDLNVASEYWKKHYRLIQASINYELKNIQEKKKDLEIREREIKNTPLLKSKERDLFNVINSEEFKNLLEEMISAQIKQYA